MNIKLDVSFFPDHFIPIIITSEEMNPYYMENFNIRNGDGTLRFLSFEFPGSIKELEQLLNSFLQENSLCEYVVAQDTENENTLTLLKVGDIEQLGMFVCAFCGAVFSDEDGKYIHQRAHYFF